MKSGQKLFLILKINHEILCAACDGNKAKVNCVHLVNGDKNGDRKEIF